MSKLPTLEETGEAVRNQGRTLLPWLPDPHECDGCGAYCLADVTFDPMMVEYTDAWVCPECDAAYYRERY